MRFGRVSRPSADGGRTRPASAGFLVILGVLLVISVTRPFMAQCELTADTVDAERDPPDEDEP